MKHTKIQLVTLAGCLLLFGCHGSNPVSRLIGLDDAHTQASGTPAPDITDQSLHADRGATVLRLHMAGLTDDGFGNKSQLKMSAKIKVKDDRAKLEGESTMLSITIAATEENVQNAGATGRRSRPNVRGRDLLVKGWPAVVEGVGKAVMVADNIKVDFDKIVFRLPRQPFHLIQETTDENGKPLKIYVSWKNNVLTQTYTDSSGITSTAKITCDEEGCPTTYQGQLEVMENRVEMRMLALDGSRIALSGVAK